MNIVANLKFFICLQTTFFKIILSLQKANNKLHSPRLDYSYKKLFLKVSLVTRIISGAGRRHVPLSDNVSVTALQGNETLLHMSLLQIKHIHTNIKYLNFFLKHTRTNKLFNLKSTISYRAYYHTRVQKLKDKKNR